MNRNIVLGLMAASALTLSGVAAAQTSTPTDPAQGQTTPAQTTPAPETPVTNEVTPPANQATEPSVKAETATTAQSSTSTQPAKPPASIDAIKEKASKLSAKERGLTAQELKAEETKVDKEATAKGGQVVAGRLGEEFSISADALVVEKDHFKTGWGNLMIARTLLANAKTSITLQQLFDMHADGLGWGEIAHGMELDLGELRGAVRAETQVATGLAKGDGHVATIGAHAATNANANASVAARTKVAPAKAAMEAGVGAGVGVTHGKAGK